MGIPALIIPYVLAYDSDRIVANSELTGGLTGWRRPYGADGTFCIQPRTAFADANLSWAKFRGPYGARRRATSFLCRSLDSWCVVDNSSLCRMFAGVPLVSRLIPGRLPLPANRR